MLRDDEDDDFTTSMGVTRYGVMPSLMTLGQMRNRHQLAQLGKKLMKWTMMAAGKELRRLAHELCSAYATYGEDVRAAYIKLARARFFVPFLNDIVRENHPKRSRLTITSTTKMVSGFKLVRYNVLDSYEDSYPHLGISQGGHAVHEAKAVWLDLVKRIIGVIEIRTSFEHVAMVHSSATKKFHAMTKILIPKIVITLRYISSEIEEDERQETFRLKRFKQLKTKTIKRETRACRHCHRVLPKSGTIKHLCVKCAALFKQLLLGELGEKALIESVLDNLDKLQMANTGSKIEVRDESVLSFVGDKKKCICQIEIIEMYDKDDERYRDLEQVQLQIAEPSLGRLSRKNLITSTNSTQLVKSFKLNEDANPDMDAPSTPECYCPPNKFNYFPKQFTNFSRLSFFGGSRPNLIVNPKEDQCICMPVCLCTPHEPSTKKFRRISIFERNERLTLDVESKINETCNCSLTMIRRPSKFGFRAKESIDENITSTSAATFKPDFIEDPKIRDSDVLCECPPKIGDQAFESEEEKDQCICSMDEKFFKSNKEKETLKYEIVKGENKANHPTKWNHLPGDEGTQSQKMFTKIATLKNTPKIELSSAGHLTSKPLEYEEKVPHFSLAQTFEKWSIIGSKATYHGTIFIPPPIFVPNASQFGNQGCPLSISPDQNYKNEPNQEEAVNDALVPCTSRPITGAKIEAKPAEQSYVDKKIKEIIKVSRKKNHDGTISEEKKVITIEVEIRTLDRNDNNLSYSESESRLSDSTPEISSIDESKENSSEDTHTYSETDTMKIDNFDQVSRNGQLDQAKRVSTNFETNTGPKQFCTAENIVDHGEVVSRCDIGVGSGTILLEECVAEYSQMRPNKYEDINTLCEICRQVINENEINAKDQNEEINDLCEKCKQCLNKNVTSPQNANFESTTINLLNNYEDCKKPSTNKRENIKRLCEKCKKPINENEIVENSKATTTNSVKIPENEVNFQNTDSNIKTTNLVKKQKDCAEPCVNKNEEVNNLCERCKQPIIENKPKKCLGPCANKYEVIDNLCEASKQPINGCEVQSQKFDSKLITKQSVETYPVCKDACTDTCDLINYVESVFKVLSKMTSMSNTTNPTIKSFNKYNHEYSETNSYSYLLSKAISSETKSCDNGSKEKPIFFNEAPTSICDAATTPCCEDLLHESLIPFEIKSYIDDTLCKLLNTKPVIRKPFDKISLEKFRSCIMQPTDKIIPYKLLPPKTCPGKYTYLHPGQCYIDKASEEQFCSSVTSRKIKYKTTKANSCGFNQGNIEQKCYKTQDICTIKIIAKTTKTTFIPKLHNDSSYSLCDQCSSKTSKTESDENETDGSKSGESVDESMNSISQCDHLNTRGPETQIKPCVHISSNRKEVFETATNYPEVHTCSQTNIEKCESEANHPVIDNCFHCKLGQCGTEENVPVIHTSHCKIGECVTEASIPAAHNSSRSELHLSSYHETEERALCEPIQTNETFQQCKTKEYETRQLFKPVQKSCSLSCHYDPAFKDTDCLYDIIKKLHVPLKQPKRDKTPMYYSMTSPAYSKLDCCNHDFDRHIYTNTFKFKKQFLKVKSNCSHAPLENRCPSCITINGIDKNKLDIHSKDEDEMASICPEMSCCTYYEHSIAVATNPSEILEASRSSCLSYKNEKDRMVTKKNPENPTKTYSEIENEETNIKNSSSDGIVDKSDSAYDGDTNNSTLDDQLKHTQNTNVQCCPTPTSSQVASFNDEVIRPHDENLVDPPYSIQQNKPRMSTSYPCICGKHEVMSNKVSIGTITKNIDRYDPRTCFDFVSLRGQRPLSCCRSFPQMGAESHCCTVGIWKPAQYDAD